MRLWVMVRAGVETLEANKGRLPIINAGNHFMTSRAIKTSIDGALGSFGAWLLESYEDKADFIGQNTTPVEDVQAIAKFAFENDLQYCVHAIGDRANRTVLDIYEQTFTQDEAKQDLRWRIEHSQHIHPDDIPRFGELGVIASMQGIHCTSDAPFVFKRLGEKRAESGAYMWQDLMKSGAVVVSLSSSFSSPWSPWSSGLRPAKQHRSCTSPTTARRRCARRITTSSLARACRARTRGVAHH